MGETPDQLVQEIEQARTALDRDLQSLEQQIKHQVDRRIKPLLVTAMALGCAVLAGLVTRLVIRSLNRR
jgi:hypothetical protein